MFDLIVSMTDSTLRVLKRLVSASSGHSRSGGRSKCHVQVAREDDGMMIGYSGAGALDFRNAAASRTSFSTPNSFM